MIGGAPDSEHAAKRAKDVREQRRYEIARDVMAALWSLEHVVDLKRAAAESVLVADALLAALEES